MFYFSQKSFLLFAFLSILPLSVSAMEENKKSSRFSKFFNYNFRKESTQQAINATFVDTLETALNINGTLTQKDAQAIQDLLARGANPNLEINYLLKAPQGSKKIKMTPLYAILYTSKSLLHNKKLDNVEMGIVKNLLENKANPNIENSSTTPLFYAISCNDENTVDLLLQHGAQVDIKDFDGETPLISAINENNCPIIKKLCAAGAPLVDTDNKTVFHYMAHNQIPKKCIETVIASARPDFELNITDLDMLASRIIWLKEILQKNSTKEGNTLQILTNLPTKQKSRKYVEDVWSLFDGSQLDDDYTFLAKNPNLLNPDYLTKNPELKTDKLKKNLAWKMLDFNNQN